MPSDQFDFVRHGPLAKPITLHLVHCHQLILTLIEVICGNCLNAINNGSACSVLLLSTPGLFPALRKTLEHSTASRALKFFCLLETTLSCSKTVLSTLKHCLLRYYTPKTEPQMTPGNNTYNVRCTDFMRLSYVI